MANKREYLDKLRRVIEYFHKCAAYWIRTEHVCEVFRAKTIWEGDVEVFGIAGHAKSMRCYGWAYGEPAEFITILELPPVDSARAAVKVGMAYQAQKARNPK